MSRTSFRGTGAAQVGARCARKRGEAEARLLRDLLERRRKRLAKPSAEFDLNQLLLPE